ncbi:hypothetical protein [Halorubrum sp. T3]|uniref:hypothetical protein n=1 Tax=Halorubrum sp. T3 TaxID=1194088 RepID=UPI001ED9B8FE|nr:hypothetical protein [Halorubrum sp. T3]
MVQTVEAKQVCRAVSTVLFPELKLGVKPCGEYTREDFCGISLVSLLSRSSQIRVGKRSSLTVASKWT